MGAIAVQAIASSTIEAGLFNRRQEINGKAMVMKRGGTECADFFCNRIFCLDCSNLVVIFCHQR